jgi:Outer membrane protein beta-barrel domain
MRGKACCGYSFTVSKLFIMVTGFMKLRGSVPRLFLQIIAAGFVIVYITGCGCQQYCIVWGSLMQKKNKNLGFTGNCDICKEGSNDSTGNYSPSQGEIFSNTITIGPALSFKSSNDKYGSSYGKHEPGIGFHVGAGTLLPFNTHWSVAPSVRFKQMTASETISYAMPGGGEPTEYKDTYKYNYVTANTLVQYRVAKRLSIVAGPELNYLVSASMKSGGNSGTGERTSLTKSSNRIGLDIIAGLKYDIPAGNKRSKWGLSLIYDHRLSRLNKKQDMGYDVPAYKMKSVQLGVSYFLRR